jgi:formylglycine-generating enzyme required for sulfatase activity
MIRVFRCKWNEFLYPFDCNLASLGKFLLRENLMKRIAGCLGIVFLGGVLLSGFSTPEKKSEDTQIKNRTIKKQTAQKKSAEAGSKVFTNSIGMQLRLIPAGSFLMGSPDNEEGREGHEGPQHKVTLTKPYYIGICEVTQEQYEKVVGLNPSKNIGPQKPVEMISCYDAKDFCTELSKIEKQEYRLPTEAEWEYACRAGTQTAYYWGDTFDKKYAWCDENSGGKSHEVGTLKPNAWGLFDMGGNVYEWCQDSYDFYSEGEQVNPQGGPDAVTRCVIRGGDWYYVSRRCRSADRMQSNFTNRNDRIGFRVVAVPTAGQ